MAFRAPLGSITLPGARLIALADNPVGGGDGVADLRLLTMSGSVDVTHSGFFALGSIVTSDSPLRPVSLSAIQSTNRSIRAGPPWTLAQVNKPIDDADQQASSHEVSHG